MPGRFQSEHPAEIKALAHFWCWQSSQLHFRVIPAGGLRWLIVMMEALKALLPAITGIELNHVELNTEDQQLLVQLASTSSSSCCPRCTVASNGVHSHYQRSIMDLPLAGWSLRFSLAARKFRCKNSDCSKKVFCERLPTLVSPWARKTLRLSGQHLKIGVAVGGAPGERLSSNLGIPVSRSTLLRQVRAIPKITATPRVIAVDDWAKRKGQKYGTIIINLETGKPIELLDDREASTLAQWLQAHPGVEVIARDRAGAYALGAATGAPGAIQVADRFHLFQNAAAVLLRVFEAHRRLLSEAATNQETDNPQSSATEDGESASGNAVSLPKVSKQSSRQQRQERFERVQELLQQGHSFTVIGALLQLNRKTVRAYAQTEFPERTQHPSKLDAFKPYLLERWNNGYRTAAELHEEITRSGYQGGRSIVADYLTRLRKAAGLPLYSRSNTPRTMNDPVRNTPRQLIWRVLAKPESVTPADELLLDHLRNAHPELDEAISLTLDFTRIFRERLVGEFDSWLERAASSAPAFQRFAKSLRKDYAAVRAALTEPWSTGPAEGHINKLKLLKRSMYGRAKTDLLEQRLLHAI